MADLSPTPFLSCFVLTRDARFAGQRADLSLIQTAISVLAAHAPVPRGDVPMRAPGHRTGQGPQNHDPGLVERSRAQSWGSAGPTRLQPPEWEQRAGHRAPSSPPLAFVFNRPGLFGAGQPSSEEPAVWAQNGLPLGESWKDSWDLVAQHSSPESESTSLRLRVAPTSPELCTQRGPPGDRAWHPLLADEEAETHRG